MAEPSTSFSSLNPLPPRVVGIGYGVFETPQDALNPFQFTVPANYNLFISKDAAPAADVGSSGDWFFRTTSDSVVVYQKTNKWNAFTTIVGGSVADLTPIYNDLAILTASVDDLEGSINTILAIYATKDYVEVKKTEAVTASNGFTTASVLAESTARAQADGFLEGKYTLKVTAGNVVTGMNITSSTGNGVDVSSVIFQADKFEIWNGSSAQAVFALNGSDVTIAGWKINPNTLVGGQTTLNSTGFMTVGTGNDVAVMSSANATYRFWAGHANPALAPFSVTKTGDIVATSGTFSGVVDIGTGNERTLIDGTGVTFGDEAVAYAKIFNGTGPAYTLFEVATGAIFLASATSGIVMRPSIDTNAFDTRINGTHTFTKFRITSDGWLKWSNGTVAVFDASLYRSGAATLRTDANLVVDLDCSAATFTGSGAALTSLDADELSSGTVPDARFPATLPAISGANLTNLDASNVSSGTLSNSRLAFTPGNLASLNISTQTLTGDVPVNGFVTINGIKLATVA